jgi:hypothetical protein
MSRQLGCRSLRNCFALLRRSFLLTAGVSEMPEWGLKYRYVEVLAGAFRVEFLAHPSSSVSGTSGVAWLNRQSEPTEVSIAGGGKKIAKRRSEYFSQLQAKRNNRKSGLC